MAEPEIRYTTTADGVSIAYYTMGEGPPMVRASNYNNSHLLVGRRTYRAAMEAQERRHRVVRYDGRGTGLSQRASPDFSLGARLLDLEAVADRLRIERFDLAGWGHGGLAAVAYAVRHPERVAHLILHDAYARGRDFFELPTGRAVQSMRTFTKDQWESYTLTVASLDLEFSDGDRAKESAALMRASIEPDALLVWRDATIEIDVTDLLPHVRVPTLVLCGTSPRFGQPELSQALASRIPGARLAVLGPRTGAAVDEQWLRTIEEFLGYAAPVDDPAPSTPDAAPPRGRAASAFRVILFTDMVGHTEMMQRLGDAKGREVLRDHERITREALQQHGGDEVKTDGDSFMATFTSPSAAVACAVALQRAFAQHAEAGGEPIVIRMGLNVGEPIEEEGDFFGSAVILASRIRDLAGGGEILVPEAVRHMLSGKSFVFADRGEFAMKGFDDAVRLYEVRWRKDDA